MMSVLSASTGLEAAMIRRLLLIVVSIAIVLGVERRRGSRDGKCWHGVLGCRQKIGVYPAAP